MGVLARMLAKMNYLTLCGMLAGSMTDPPALAFANNLHATSGAAALSYATVYPLVMFLRIITPQLLAVLFWGAKLAGFALDAAQVIVHLILAGVAEHDRIVKKLAAVAVGKGGNTQQRRLLRDVH